MLTIYHKRRRIRIEWVGRWYLVSSVGRSNNPVPIARTPFPDKALEAAFWWLRVGHEVDRKTGIYITPKASR